MSTRREFPGHRRTLMKKVQRTNRCAQCGRRYTKAQWRRNDFWCSKCKKFVCYDCVSRGFICPACGTKTNRTVKRGASLGAMLGATFLLLPLIILALSYSSDTDLWFIWPMVAIGASSAVVFVVLSILSRRHNCMHQEHLSRMPSGTIPIEERPGHGNVEVRRKWREAFLAGSGRGPGIGKETHPDHMYYGLVGDWDFPVMSKQQRISMTAGIQRKALIWGAGTLGLGAFLMILGIFIGWNVVVFLFGVLVILVGLMIVFVARYAKQMVQSDAKAKVKVSWKTVGFGTAKGAVEGFLEEQRLEARLKKTKLPMWKRPEHTYELPDGNEISFTYSEDSSGHVFGWVEIGFRPSGALAAKRLQKELDEYLSERDLVWRVG